MLAEAATIAPKAVICLGSALTSLASVFAISDARAESTKRVAAAVGEGAAVVGQIHASLAGLKGLDAVLA